jgi:hypothetical protein
MPARLPSEVIEQRKAYAAALRARRIAELERVALDIERELASRAIQIATLQDAQRSGLSRALHELERLQIDANQRKSRIDSTRGMIKATAERKAA